MTCDFYIGQRVMSKWCSIDPWRGEIIEIHPERYLHAVVVKLDMDNQPHGYLAVEVKGETDGSNW